MVLSGVVHITGVRRVLQSLLRKEAPTLPAPDMTERSRLAASLNTMCFHCDILDLFALKHLGVLDQPQSDALVERSLWGESDDEIHKCGLGTGEFPVLKLKD
jgi:hypothetical protein